VPERAAGEFGAGADGGSRGDKCCDTSRDARINDTAYRADGAPAGGTLLISWAAFTTAENSPVAAGNKSVQLGAQGALSVDLVPN
jgi:hypothetical protein